MPGNCIHLYPGWRHSHEAVAVDTLHISHARSWKLKSTVMCATMYVIQKQSE